MVCGLTRICDLGRMRNHFLVDRLLPDAVDGSEQAGLFVDKREFAQSA